MISFQFEPGMEIWVLGTSFLKKYQSIFDMDEMRVGLVNSDPETVSVTLTIIDIIRYVTLTLIGFLSIFLLYMLL